MTNDERGDDVAQLPTLQLWRTAAIAVLVEGLLRCTSLPRTCELLGLTLHDAGPGLADADTRPAPSSHEIEFVERLVSRVYSFVPRWDTCLRRALTAGFRLRRFQPQLVLGVKKHPSLQAHAWLLLGGSPLDGADVYRDYVRIQP